MSYRRKWWIWVVMVCLWAGGVWPVMAGPETPVETPLPSIGGTQVEHVVVDGESLSVIARQYGVSAATLQEANGITDADRIVVGQRLIIPGAVLPTATPTVMPAASDDRFNAIHVVLAGETLGRIAARYGTTTAELAAVNGLADPNYLSVGQRLLVPGDSGAVEVGLSEQKLAWPFTALELRSPEPAQGDTVVVWVETADDAKDATVKGSFEGQEIRLAHQGRTHWGLLPIHPMAAVGPYEVRLQASAAGKAPASVVVHLRVRAGNFDIERLTIPPSKTNLLDAELVRIEREKLGQALEITDALPLWHGLFIYPVPDVVVSSEFGVRRSYNGGPVSGFHEGLDLDVDKGKPVKAAADGRVVMAEPLAVRGNAVLIDHGLGVHTGYWHLSEIDVTVGQEVKAGEVIGKVGSTGLATGPHLHWEIRIGQINVNPVQWTRQTFP